MITEILNLGHILTFYFILLTALVPYYCPSAGMLLMMSESPESNRDINLKIFQADCRQAHLGSKWTMGSQSNIHRYKFTTGFMNTVPGSVMLSVHTL